MRINSAKELEVYKKAYSNSMRIFVISKPWPAEEKYSLIDQIRRSSRSVCSNLREAWAKRRYEAYFISKLTDCDGENGETDTWLDYACDCEYIAVDLHDELTKEVVEVGRMLGPYSKGKTNMLVLKNMFVLPITAPFWRASTRH